MRCRAHCSAVCQLPHLPSALEERRGRARWGFVEAGAASAQQAFLKGWRAGLEELWAGEGGPGCWQREKVWWVLTSHRVWPSLVWKRERFTHPPNSPDLLFASPPTRSPRGFASNFAANKLWTGNALLFPAHLPSPEMARAALPSVLCNFALILLSPAPEQTCPHTVHFKKRNLGP